MDERDILRVIMSMIYDSDIPIKTIAKKAGISTSTIYGWFCGRRRPALNTVEWVMQAIGYKIVFVKEETNDKKTIEENVE